MGCTCSCHTLRPCPCLLVWDRLLPAVWGPKGTLFTLLTHWPLFSLLLALTPRLTPGWAEQLCLHGSLQGTWYEHILEGS